MNEMLVIKKMTYQNWGDVARIYKEGIDTQIATFEKTVPNWETWDINHLKECRFVASIHNQIVGWAALSPVSSRCVYGGVGEVSVYVTQTKRGNKIGEKLLKKLIEESEINGLWTLQSGIFPENKASIKLHLKLGFRTIGYKEKIGQLDGIWKDNILLEKRSKLIGIN